MAYTSVVRPDTFTPVYNPIYFYPSSTNHLEVGFKYIVDVYSGTTQNIKLGRYKLFPRPNDGYGVADINQLLSSQVGYYLDQNMNTISKSLPSFIDYNLSFGEEWVYFWNFTDNANVLSGPYTGRLSFVNSGIPNQFQAGDYVFVDQDPGYTEPGYNGVFEVLTAYTGTVIVNAPFTTVTPVNPGTMYFSDKRKVEYLNLLNLNGYTAFNGAIPHQDFINYSSVTYTMTSGSTVGKFLTDVPNNYRVKPSNSMWLNFHSNDSYKNTRIAVINTFYGTYALAHSITGQTSVMTLATGPYNVDTAGWNVDFGTAPVFKNICWNYDQVVQSGSSVVLISSTEANPWYGNYNDQVVNFYIDSTLKTDSLINSAAPNQVTLFLTPFSAFTSQSGTLFQTTDWYTVQMYDNLGNPSSELKRFEVDWSTTRYGNVELVFIDRLGSFIPANFELQKTTTINVTRNEYQSLLGDKLAGTSRWGYDSTERGRNVLNTQVVKQIDLISNWITEEESEYLQELYTSPQVYIKENGKLWPVIVKTNSYRIVTKKNRKNIQVQISIEMANNDRIQNF